MYSRRAALKLAGIGAVGTVVGQVSPSGGKLRVRRDLAGMKLDDPDLETYREFVRIMKSKDQSQPLSWLGFSKQHGQIFPNGRGAYKFCPHGNWYFLPWHRAFMTMYEVAAQVLTGNPDFAMPFWNWTANRTLPEAFKNPTYKGKPNPLYVPNRKDLTGDNALTDDLVGPERIKAIYDETNYEAFGTSRPQGQDSLDPKWVIDRSGYQGPVESPPHNQVHNHIGAFMPSPASPRDPIFFMHHGNIDRIWATWNSLGRKNSTNSLWLDMPFQDNYLDPTGKPYTKVVKDLLDWKAFGYTYPDLPQADGKEIDPERERAMLAFMSGGVGDKIAGIQRVGGNIKMNAMVTDPLDSLHGLEPETLAKVASPEPKEQHEVFASIRDIEIPEKISHLRVFINKENLSLETPVTDPHFVSNVSFLVHPKTDGEGHKGLPSVLVNLTDTIKKLGAQKKLSGDNITVQLLPVPEAGEIVENTGKVVPASIEIIVL